MGLNIRYVYTVYFLILLVLVTLAHGVEKSVVILLLWSWLIAVGTRRRDIGVRRNRLALYRDGGRGSGDIFGADGRG